MFQYQSMLLAENYVELGSSGIVCLKKLSFKGHVFFEPISAENLQNALAYLKC